jgi:lipopolysaccharide transport system ATP-binding protein
MTVVVKVENVSKKYHLGTIGTQSLKGDMQRWWSKVKGKENPLAKIGDKERDTGEFWALKDINFEINQGEAIGIIGKNGAGKSTLLKILSRITNPTTGNVKIKGRIASLLEVGTGFNPELTGRENIYLNGAILGMRKQEVKAKFDEIVDFSGVEKFIDTPVKRYSSGMYVRLAFAVAAHLESEILILDEVLAVGDAEFQKKCLGKMDDVAHKQGRTILFVSHGLSAIKSFCNRGIVLQKGKVIGDSDVSTAIELYNSNSNSTSNTLLFKEWSANDAPHNNSAALLKVCICDEYGNHLTNVYTDTAFTIEIDYKVLKANAIIGLTLILYDFLDNCIFSSINNLETQYYGKPMPLGEYKSICIIPGNLLNDGKISVSINLFEKKYTNAVTADKVITMEVQDSHSIRGDYSGGFGGAIRPFLEWKTLQFSIKN